jgi:hypothetical protein
MSAYQAAAETVSVLAQAQLDENFGSGLVRILLAILGGAIVAVVAFRAFAAFAANKFGLMLGIIAAAIIPAGLCFFPESSVDLLKSGWQLVVGS